MEVSVQIWCFFLHEEYLVITCILLYFSFFDEDLRGRRWTRNHLPSMALRGEHDMQHLSGVFVICLPCFLSMIQLLIDVPYKHFSGRVSMTEAGETGYTIYISPVRQSILAECESDRAVKPSDLRLMLGQVQMAASWGNAAWQRENGGVFLGGIMFFNFGN